MKAAVLGGGSAPLPLVEGWGGTDNLKVVYLEKKGYFSTEVANKWKYTLINGNLSSPERILGQRKKGKEKQLSLCESSGGRGLR